jgi:glycosyltransferase involved in cell wall biosynthesis
MRLAIVYDCLYPNTVGGAERWLRVLAEELGREHEVTYVTRRQWAVGEEPEIPGVECVSVSPPGPLYTEQGRRRLRPPVEFAVGVFWHFLRHRGHYDVVHCVSYPYLPLIALRLALAGSTGTRVFCEWLECLTPQYWHAYAGRFGGLLGRVVQATALRLSPSAFCFSDLVESRLRESSFRGELHRLTGLYLDNGMNGASPIPPPEEPLVLFAGRHVPDKRVAVLPEAIAEARRSDPRLRGVIVGDGPERGRVLERIDRLGLQGVVEAPGFIERDELVRLLGRATCLVSPSIRDGHGMMAVEAAAAGLPVVVCRNPENAATEHIAEGVNGVVASSSSPRDIADGLLRVVADAEALRMSTREWYAENADRLSMSDSIERVRQVYGAEARRIAALAAAA